MAPICLSLPSLAHIFAFHLKNKKSEKIMLRAKTRGVEKNPIGNVESLFMSRVRGRGVDWCRVGPCGFDVNIFNNINYIPRGGLHLYLSLSFPLSFLLPPSLVWRLKYVKVTWTEWYFTVTEERERHSNMLMIWWWARQKMKVYEEKTESRKEGAIFLNE